MLLINRCLLNRMRVFLGPHEHVSRSKRFQIQSLEKLLWFFATHVKILSIKSDLYRLTKTTSSPCYIWAKTHNFTHYPRHAFSFNYSWIIFFTDVQNNFLEIGTGFKTFQNWLQSTKYNWILDGILGFPINVKRFKVCHLAYSLFQRRMN